MGQRSVNNISKKVQNTGLLKTGNRNIAAEYKHFNGNRNKNIIILSGITTTPPDKKSENTGPFKYEPSIKKDNIYRSDNEGRWVYIRKAIETLEKDNEIQANAYFREAFTTPLYEDYVPMAISLEKDGECIHIPFRGFENISIASQKTYSTYLRLLLESADMFGYKSALGIDTSHDSHRIAKLLYSVGHGFEYNSIPQEELRLFCKSIYLLMFGLKLCSFRHILYYLKDRYRDDIFKYVGEGRRDEKLHYLFDSFTKYILSLPQDHKKVLYILERAIYLQELLYRDFKDSSDWTGLFADYIKKQSGIIKKNYGPEIRSNNMLAAMLNYLDELAGGNSKRDEELNLLTSELLAEDKDIKNDLLKGDGNLSVSLIKAGVVRASIYSVEYRVDDEGGNNEILPFVTFKNSIGKKRTRPSSFIGGTLIDITEREIDGFLLSAIKSQKPTYGIALRYDKQPPFWFIPIVKDGKTSEFILAEVDHYYFDKNIAVNLE